jgi:hypothetical protein
VTAEDEQREPEEEQADGLAADDDPAGLKALGGFAEQVRSTARWLIGAFAAVGLLLVPALPLSDIGSLEGARMAWAIVAIAVAVAAVIASVIMIVRFLSPGATSLAELAAREAKHGDDDELVAYFSRNKALLQGQARSLSELHERYVKARARWLAALEAEADDKRLDRVALAQESVDALTAVVDELLAVARLYGPADVSLAQLAAAEGAAEDEVGDALRYLSKHPAFLGGYPSVRVLREEVARAHEQLLGAQEEAAAEEEAGASLELIRTELEVIEQPIVQIEAVAAYQDLRLPFLRRRWLVALATALVALAIAGLAVAAHEPEPSKHDFSGKTLNNLDLSGTNLEGAEFEDTTFVDSNLTGADVDKADFDGARFIRTRCPSGVLSTRLGSRCPKGHLKLKKPGPVKPVGLLQGGDPASG